MTQARKTILLHSSTFPRKPAPTPRGREAPQCSARLPRCLARRIFPAQRRRPGFRPPPHKLRGRSAAAAPSRPLPIPGQRLPPRTSLTRSASGCSGFRSSHCSGLAMSARPRGEALEEAERTDALTPRLRAAAGRGAPRGRSRPHRCPSWPRLPRAPGAGTGGSRARAFPSAAGARAAPPPSPSVTHQPPRRLPALPGFSRPPCGGRKAPNQLLSSSPLPSACQTGAGNGTVAYVLAFATAGAH